MRRPAPQEGGVGKRSCCQRCLPAPRTTPPGSPFDGLEGQGWFLNFHCFTKYVEVAFFRGRSLRPVPPGESKHQDVRYLDIHEDDQLDEEPVPRWIRQASDLPGMNCFGSTA